MPSAFQDFVGQPLQPIDGGTGSTDLTLTNATLSDPINIGASAGSLSGFRNRLINPQFAINRRNLTQMTDGTYGFDRWYGLSESGAINYTTILATTGFSRTRGQFTNAIAGSQRFGVAQVIEASNIFDFNAGQFMTFSGNFLTTTAGITLRYAVLLWTGAIDTVTLDIVNNWASTNYTPGNFFTNNVTVQATGEITPVGPNVITAFPSSPGVGGARNSVIVFVWSTTQVTTGNGFQLWNLSLMPGQGSMPFEVRPTATELALCEYYLPAISSTAANNVIAVGYLQNTTTGFVAIRFPRVRSPVTGVVVSAASQFTVATTALSQALTTLTFNAGGQDGALLQFTAAGAFAAGAPTILSSNAANATIYFTGAEL